MCRKFLNQTSDAFSCAFPERRIQRKDTVLRQTEVSHLKQWQREFHCKCKSGFENFTFCLQMRWTSGRRRKCCRSLFGYQWQTGTGFVFNSGLPTLAGRPLSSMSLLTLRLPSIPGLFLCGRQHPASGCLTVSEHPMTGLEHIRPQGQAQQQWNGSQKQILIFKVSPHHLLNCNYGQVA